MLKWISLGSALLSVVSGLVAAYYWYLASRVEISPAWPLDIHGDREKNVMGWVAGNMIAFTKSGKLNKRAARWTALAVASSAISIFVSAVK
jgi:hypothetical protein